MHVKTKVGFLGAIAVLLVLGLQSVEHWTLIDALLREMRESGSFGLFVTRVLLSRQLPLALVIAALYLIYDGRREESASAEFRNGSISARSKLESNPVQSQIASPHIEQHVHLSEKKPQHHEKEEPPSVSFIQSRDMLLHEGQLGVWHEASTNLERAHHGIVAQFRNPPSKTGDRTAIARAVSASLVFKADGLPEDLHISHGMWLGRFENVIDFRAGNAHQLLVAVRTAFPVVTYENPNSSNPLNRRWRSGMSVRRPQAYTLPGREGEVEISLVDSSSVTVFNGRFEYLITPDEMILRKKP